MREVVAGAGAHEGRVGRIWDGGGILRRGQACQRAKAEGGIDEKGVRGCGDGERGDSEAEVGRGGSFFGAVSPTRAPQATSYAHTRAAPMVHPYAPHAFRPPTALPYAFHMPHAFRPMALPYESMALPYASMALPYASTALPYASQPMPMHPTSHLWPRPCPTQRVLSSTPQLYPHRPDTHRHMTTHPAHTQTPSACRRPPTVRTSQPQYYLAYISW